MKYILYLYDFNVFITRMNYFMFSKIVLLIS